MRVLLRCIGAWMVVLIGSGFSTLSGQYYDWGRSPQSIRWNQAKTAEGTIIFPDYYQKNAARIASYMGQLRPSVAYGFKYGPLRMPVLLHTQNFVSNGIVIWAPKRIELEAIPPAAPFAEPWHKQLIAHEYRHAVQYNNLYRGPMKWLGYLIGQQSGLISSVLMPIWFLEGDAVMHETQTATYGRALQPSFTIEYRAYLTEGKRKFALDKWFCGSYKDYIPDHYQFGYQLAAWSRERYGDDMWSRVAEYASKRPYTIFTTPWALRKYFGTTSGRIARETLDELERFWKAQPVEPNSSTIIPTPITSYTVYSAPMKLNDTTVLALKRDMDRTSRVVVVDSRSGKERRLFYTGSVNTAPVLRDSVLYWSEYRNSTFWSQRISSKICSYDLRSGKRRTLRHFDNALFPQPLDDGTLAAIGYDYRGIYRLEFSDGRQFNLPDTVSVHGLAYDDRTRTLAVITLSDAGMAIRRIDPETGAMTALTEPSYVSIYNLRGGAGKLSFNSIASGKDEIHLYDLEQHREFRLSRSRYGSVAPSDPASDDTLLFTTYSLEGYRLARQPIVADSLVPVGYRKIPENRVNPPRRKWNIINIDTVRGDSLFRDGVRVKRYRKGTHLFNLHSWAPWNFNPFNIAGESRIDVGFGATVMSQNLLANTFGYLAYGYSPGNGSLLRGALNYYGWAPKFEFSFLYGGGKQQVYGTFPEDRSYFARKEYLDLGIMAYLPMTLSSGRLTRTLAPAVELRHTNALLVEDSSVTTGYQRMVVNLTYSENVRMATRDLLPRWGYLLRASMVCAPFSSKFSRIYSLFGRVYLPGVMMHHSLTLRGNLQRQKTATYGFYYKELFPRGARYNVSANRLGALSVDYQFPVWCPDGGINGILYFRRIRLNGYYDFARIESPVGGSHLRSTQTVTSYGGELIFDVQPLRLPVNTASVGVYVYKPSDRAGVVTGVSLSLPL